MKLELVQLAGRDGDTADNLEQVLRAIGERTPGSDIVVFPEAYLTGFLDHDNIAQYAEPVDGDCVETLCAAAREHDVAVVVGLIEREGERFYNTTLFITPESGVTLRYRKTHLWVGEPGLVLPGDRFTTVHWRGVRIGLLICYDIEFPESACALAALGAELILITDGNMQPYGHVHHTAVAARAQENRGPAGCSMRRPTLSAPRTAATWRIASRVKVRRCGWKRWCCSRTRRTRSRACNSSTT